MALQGRGFGKQWLFLGLQPLLALEPRFHGPVKIAFAILLLVDFGPGLGAEAIRDKRLSFREPVPPFVEDRQFELRVGNQPGLGQQALNLGVFPDRAREQFQRFTEAIDLPQLLWSGGKALCRRDDRTAPASA